MIVVSSMETVVATAGVIILPLKPQAPLRLRDSNT